MSEILGFTPQPLYYISQFAGLVMVVGGIWLIYKEKIYVDRESKTVTEIGTPFGTFRTNIPALFLFVLGFIPIFYPIVKSASVATEVPIEGQVTSNHYPVEVIAVANTQVVDKEGSFKLEVPFFGSDTKDYRVIYYYAGNILDVVPVPVQTNGPINVGSKVYEISDEKAVTIKPGNVAPKPSGF